MVSSIKGVHELVQLCIAYGIKHVVVSPGSRNAPLSVSFDHYAKQINCCVIPDERSAAFFALGIALAKHEPVAVVCTSGSAALNYAPAVSEAFYQKIPLIVLTADRPQAWINQSDGQTIMQSNLYGNHVKKSVNLPVVQSADDAWWHNRLINEAFLSATTVPLGPVHINVPLNEPLYGLTEPEKTPVRKIEKIKNSGVFSIDAIKSINELVAKNKVMVVAGQMLPNHEIDAMLGELASSANFVVLCESTSNLKNDAFVYTIDRVIDGMNEAEKKSFAPEVLITLGDAIVSKKVKAWIRKNAPQLHLHIGKEHDVIDTYGCLSHWIDEDVKSVLPFLLSANDDSTFASEWKKLNDRCEELHCAYLQQAKWSDLKAFDVLFHSIEKANYHLGNSTPIRYAQLFRLGKEIHSYSNRGTSGIDGCTSTAAGFAYVNDELNVLFTGDISFYYDSNALWNNYLKPNLKIVLINNSGGNIFRIIDGPNNNALTEKYFEAKQKTNAKMICAQYGISYFEASDEGELKAVLKNFIADKSCSLLELFTDNINSPAELKNYFEFIKTKRHES